MPTLSAGQAVVESLRTEGVPYVFEGHMTYVVMNSPGYVPDSDRVVE